MSKKYENQQPNNQSTLDYRLSRKWYQSDNGRIKADCSENNVVSVA